MDQSEPIQEADKQEHQERPLGTVQIGLFAPDYK